MHLSTEDNIRCFEAIGRVRCLPFPISPALEEAYLYAMKDQSVTVKIVESDGGRLLKRSLIGLGEVGRLHVARGL